MYTVWSQRTLGIPATTIMPGSTETVKFTPSKAGTYLLRCTIPCGADHRQMAIGIKVVLDTLVAIVRRKCFKLGARILAEAVIVGLMRFH